MATTEQKTLSTAHGTISYTISTPPNSSSTDVSAAASSPARPFILLVHGNSSSSQIFHPILTSRLAESYPMLAPDLPGHGSSSNAPSAQASYKMQHYAAALATLLSTLRVPAVAILGWSLGGHIALELAALPRSERHAAVRGLMLVGTPPASGAEEVARAFYTARPLAKKEQQKQKQQQDQQQQQQQQQQPPPPPPPEEEEEKEKEKEKEKEADNTTPNFAATAALTPAQTDLFADKMTFRPAPWLREAVARTDPPARSTMWAAFERRDEGIDQVAFVARTRLLTAVVNGAGEPFVDLGYVRGLRWGRLWEGKCHEIEGLGHAPFWEDWAVFEGFVGRWVRDCEGEEGE